MPAQQLDRLAPSPPALHASEGFLPDQSELKEAIEEKFGFNPEYMHPETLDYLAGFMAHADEASVDRLSNALRGLQEHFIPSRFPEEVSEPEQYLDLFLALEFGDELGKSLLSVLEDYTTTQATYNTLPGIEFPPPESEILMHTTLEMWHNSRLIADFFTEYDPEFAQSVEKAFAKRISEVLVVAEQIVTHGSAEAILYDGTAVRYTELHEVDHALGFLNYALNDMAIRLQVHGDAYPLREEENGAAYLVGNDDLGSSDVLVQVREYGAHFGEHDRNREFDGEARINFLVNPFSKQELLSESLDDPVRTRAVSIRLDREGYTYDENGAIAANDPTREQGAVSLDVGSIFGEPDNPNVIIGRLLGVGNALIDERRGQWPNFNHIREAFDPKYGRAEEFAELVRYVKNRLSLNTQNHSDESSDLAAA